MKQLKEYGICILILAVGLFPALQAGAAVNSMPNYVATPIFLTTAVPPNILIIFDNSGSMNFMAYWDESNYTDADHEYDPNKNYYGYFTTGTPGNRAMYINPTDNEFTRDPNGEWDGNFLNWLTMRRIDVARKVLAGGLATSRTGGGNTTLIGEDPAQTSRHFEAQLDLTGVTPYTGTYWVGLDGGKLYVDTTGDNDPYDSGDDDYTIKVEKDESLPDEAEFFYNGNISGVMQRVADKARWGLEWFNLGTGNNQSGGTIANRVGSNMTNMITNLENKGADTWTPLAESYYVAMQYFKQEAVASGLDYPNNPFVINDTNDPYYDGNEFVWCARSYVLLLTDGASTKDRQIPAAYQNYDGDTHDPNAQTPAYASDGTDYLDDLALYARTNDLRPAGTKELDGDQNLELFVVYAFGDEPEARRLLKDSARNGGFIDNNSNNLPDPVSGTAVATVDYSTPVADGSWNEWWEDKRLDADGNAMPDTYFEADDGWQLERELIAAITKILERAGSGTAVSVLATSGEGEGALYQAYFTPKTSTATEDIYWAGFMQSLWVDARGNLREDWTDSGNTTPDGILSLDKDPIVSFIFDEASGETKFERTLVDADNLFGDPTTTATFPLADLHANWEAGDKLATRSAYDRTIYTFVDDDSDGVVDGNDSVDSDEFINFDVANSVTLKDILDLPNDTNTVEEDYAYLGDTEDNRVNNLIRYIRGDEPGVDAGFLGTYDMRKRVLNEGTADEKVWKLGDIVHSTPTPVGRPVDSFDIIYGDETYSDYFKRHQNRETVVYSGANDGMLHAFLAGVFKEQSAAGPARFIRDPASTPNKYTSFGTAYTDWAGSEIWGYIPQNLLPHLKWLADPSYRDANHVYYVDLKPRIFDARLYDGATVGTHPLKTLWNNMTVAQKADRPGGWCTLLVGGMRLGGGSITTSVGTFVSSYFAIDITDPKNPIPLWEQNYPGLGFTTSFPAIIKVEEKTIQTATVPDTVTVDDSHWYLVFGSGPTPNYYDGTSTQTGNVFLVDAATGRTDLAVNPGRIFTKITDANGSDTATSLPANGSMGSPVAVDLGLDYSVNVAYIGEIHGNDGGLYRLMVKVTPTTLDDGSVENVYNVDPNTWALNQLFDADYGITAAPSAAVTVQDFTTPVASDALWVYFGSGRYLSHADKSDTTQQYLYGVKDPVFNNQLDDGRRTTLLASTLTRSDLADVSNTEVKTDGTITNAPTGSSATTFEELKNEQSGVGSTFEVGWVRELDLSAERIVNKGSVLGGILLQPSFVPNDDICGFGGDSYLYALYFETGTAFSRSVFGTTGDEVDAKKHLGVGLASSVGIHVGQEAGAKGFIQQSTGTVTQIDLIPAFNIKSKFIYWREK
jgi:type IV pilus assembly protein PilY1